MATAPPRSPAQTFSGLVLDFLAYLELERGLSRNTLEAYRSDLQQYGAFLQGAGVSALDATHKELSEFIGQLTTGAGRAPVAPATVQRKVACLRSFYRHLRREEILERDPTAELRAPRGPGKLPHVLGRAEVRRLMEQPRGTSPRALRDRALLELMYACGLRASEAIGLDVDDVDLDEAVLLARGKGSKERLVPVGREAVSAVRTYLQRGRSSLVGNRAEPRLFVNSRGAGLTRQGLYKIVQRHAGSAGLAQKMSPHTLRHTFATHLLAGASGLIAAVLTWARGCAWK
jgi:integrase/recombinase XerD